MVKVRDGVYQTEVSIALGGRGNGFNNIWSYSFWTLNVYQSCLVMHSFLSDAMQLFFQIIISILYLKRKCTGSLFFPITSTIHICLHGREVYGWGVMLCTIRQWMQRLCSYILVSYQNKLYELIQIKILFFPCQPEEWGWWCWYEKNISISDLGLCVNQILFCLGPVVRRPGTRTLPKELTYSRSCATQKWKDF